MPTQAVHLDTDALFENTAQTAVTFAEHMDYQVTFTSPGGLALAARRSSGTIERVPTQTIAAFDGTLDFAGPERGRAAVDGPRRERGARSSSSDPGVLAAFTGRHAARSTSRRRSARRSWAAAATSRRRSTRSRPRRCRSATGTRRRSRRPPPRRRRPPRPRCSPRSVTAPAAARRRRSPHRVGHHVLLRRRRRRRPRHRRGPHLAQPAPPPDPRRRLVLSVSSWVPRNSADAGLARGGAVSFGATPHSLPG